MFRRIILDESAAIFAIVAFVTAATIFIAIAWRALRMPAPQADRFAQLPFSSDSAEARHDTSA